MYGDRTSPGSIVLGGRVFARTRLLVGGTTIFFKIVLFLTNTNGGRTFSILLVTKFKLNRVVLLVLKIYTVQIFLIRSYGEFYIINKFGICK